jgi:cob(I)alamin adenosyltransferase
MNIQLIQGEFNSNEALELITQMIHIKIVYHENKISKHTNEEDIKTREAKIKRLQKELYELRNFISTQGKTVKIDAVVKFD